MMNDIFTDMKLLLRIYGRASLLCFCFAVVSFFVFLCIVSNNRNKNNKKKKNEQKTESIDQYRANERRRNGCYFESPFLLITNEAQLRKCKIFSGHALKPDRFQFLQFHRVKHTFRSKSIELK